MTRTNTIFYVSNHNGDYILVYTYSIGIAKREGRKHFGSQIKECRPATKLEIADKKEVIDLGID